jgi:hypothetical protein
LATVFAGSWTSLVRSTLAFFQKVDNHVGAIHYFICHSNLTRIALLVSHYRSDIHLQIGFEAMTESGAKGEQVKHSRY